MADHQNVGALTPFDASQYHVGIVVGLFNSHITGPMKELILKTLQEDYQVPADNITVIEVAGAADMPWALEHLANKPEIDCLITAAAIIRGDTAHFDYVAKVVTEAVTLVQLAHTKPIAFGVLTTDTETQAEVRIHHAKDYVAAALHGVKAKQATA